MIGGVISTFKRKGLLRNGSHLQTFAGSMERADTSINTAASCVDIAIITIVVVVVLTCCRIGHPEDSPRQEWRFGH